MKVMGLEGKSNSFQFFSVAHILTTGDCSKVPNAFKDCRPLVHTLLHQRSKVLIQSSLYVVKNLRLRSNRTVHRSKQTNKKKFPSFSSPLGPQRLLYFASKTSLGYKRLFHDFSESVGSIPKFLMHAPCNNEPKDISTAFQTKQMLEKSSGQYLGVLIRFRDEPW